MCVSIGESTVITVRGYQLDIAVQPQLPSEFKNKDIHGLLGNYNGVASDDLVSRNGQTVDADSNERTIHYEFGETCELAYFSACLMSHLYSTTRLYFFARFLDLKMFELSRL